jgi:hypothetical protein
LLISSVCVKIIIGCGHMNTNAKRTVIVAITVIVMVVAIIGASYAYLAASIGSAATTQINVISGTVDNLVFIPGSDLTVTANQDNFGSGSGNKSGAITSQVKLTANNYSSSTQYYRAYLVIMDNTFVYTSGTTPELKLTVKRGSTTVIDGMDVTTKKGVIDIPVTSGGTTIKQSITASAGATTTENWTATVTFVNLNSNQNANAGKHFTARLYVEESPMLPSEYQEVLYIQSSGTQHILTPHIPDDTYGAMLDAQIDTFTGDQVMFGTRSTTNGRFWSGFTGSNIYLGFNTNVSYSQIANGNRYIIELNYNNTRKRNVNGNSVGDVSGTLAATTHAIAIFGGNDQGTVKYKASYKLYRFRITKGSELIANYVPCVNGSTVGLYDTIAKEFYPNVGSGTFTAGTNAN